MGGRAHKDKELEPRGAAPVESFSGDSRILQEVAAAFFGITLHADKEILMMVVEKDIRDRVLNAIYKEMGMAKKAKGIAFSLPVSDVAGLAPAPEPKEAQQMIENS